MMEDLGLMEAADGNFAAGTNYFGQARTCYSNRDDIERDFGEPLSWERLEERRASRVGIYRETTIASPPEELAEARDWAIQKVVTLKKVFAPRLEKLLR